MSDIIDEFNKAVEIIKQMPSRVNRQLIVEDIAEGRVRVYFNDNPKSYDDIPEVVWENFLHNIKNFPRKLPFIRTSQQQSYTEFLS